MLTIDTLTLGDYQTNCYIVRQEACSDCIVIDPGYEPETILGFLARKKLNLAAILLTHGHFDHVGAVRDIATETDCPVYIHEQDLSLPPMMTAGPLYYTDTYAEGDTVSPAGFPIRVLHTPGHTPGSVCLKTEGVIFSGDTLFAGSCGRTDFPGGSWADMLRSLKRLAGLSGDAPVYPGHGPATSLSAEHRRNPYFQSL